jgi:hypothetical protein
VHVRLVGGLAVSELCLTPSVELQAEYAAATRENTMRLQRLADLTAEQHTLEMSLNSTQGQLAAAEAGAAGRAGMDEEEKQRLVQLVRLQEVRTRTRTRSDRNDLGRQAPCALSCLLPSVTALIAAIDPLRWYFDGRMFPV